MKGKLVWKRIHWIRHAEQGEYRPWWYPDWIPDFDACGYWDGVSYRRLTLGPIPLPFVETREDWDLNWALGGEDE